MNYKIIFIFLLFFSSCAKIPTEKTSINIISTETYSNKGFTLLFSEDLKKKKNC